MDDARLLSRVIRIGRDEEASYSVCRSLIERFGGLRELLRADRSLLLSTPQIGNIRADMLQALPDIARRYYEGSLDTGAAIRSPADTEDFLVSRLSHLGHELFCCLYLDNRHRVLRFDKLFRGTIDGTSVYPREVVKEALSVNAAAVILAHNDVNHRYFLFLLFFLKIPSGFTRTNTRICRRDLYLEHVFRVAAKNPD